MPWYYYNENSERSELVSDRQLQDLVTQRIVTPTTRMEMENGRLGFAWQIPGLFKFNFIDESGTQGDSLSTQQLKELASQGMISPATPLRTNNGHNVSANQLSGLRFKATAPPQLDSTQTHCFIRIYKI